MVPEAISGFPLAGLHANVALRVICFNWTMSWREEEERSGKLKLGVNRNVAIAMPTSKSPERHFTPTYRDSEGIPLSRLVHFVLLIPLDMSTAQLFKDRNFLAVIGDEVYPQQ